jgi:hypothetical protein
MKASLLFDLTASFVVCFLSTLDLPQELKVVQHFLEQKFPSGRQ